MSIFRWQKLCFRLIFVIRSRQSLNCICSC
jgi:hypothetical protein